MTRWQIARALIGIGLVLHGLGNAVLPMRGIDGAGPGAGMWLPTIAALYVLAIIGFATAGLGTLGVRPLQPVAVPAAWAAALASLAAHVRAADADLWVGVVLNIVLPIAVTVVDLLAPDAQRHRPMTRWSRAGSAAGITCLAWIIVSTVAWPWHRGWGATAQEWQLALPGDRSPRTPEMEILHGVTIAVPADEIWPWLAQIGQDRAGFYSYDWLERAFGADVHNVPVLRPEWQSRRVGEQIYAVQAGYMGGLFGDRPGWTVDVFEPERALVLRNWGAFVLVPQPDGHTRLLIRSTISNPRIPAWAAALNLMAFELPHFIMQRRMLISIKTLSEQTAT